MRKARIGILIAAAAATFAATGCSSICPCASREQVSQEEIDDAIRIAKMQLIQDFIDWKMQFWNEDKVEAERYRNRVKFFEVDHFLKGREVQVYLRFSQGLQRAKTGEVHYNPKISHQALYYLRRFERKWHIYFKEVNAYESRSFNPFWTDHVKNSEYGGVTAP